MGVGATWNEPPAAALQLPALAAIPAGVCPAIPPPTPPQVLARLIRGYNFRFQPRSHGVDLVETLHVVLGVLDRLSTAGALCVHAQGLCASRCAAVLRCCRGMFGCICIA